MVDETFETGSDFIDEEGLGHYGARRGKWTTFEDEEMGPRALPDSTLPRPESRQRTPTTGGWRSDFIDIRRASRPPPPAPPLPVPPRLQQHTHSRSGSVGTRVYPSPVPSPAASPPRPRHSLASSHGTEDEESPLSPRNLMTMDAVLEQPVWKVGKIAPRRD